MAASCRNEWSGQTKRGEIKFRMTSDKTVRSEVCTADLTSMSWAAIAILYDAVGHVARRDTEHFFSGIDERHRAVVQLEGIIAVEHWGATTLGPPVHLVYITDQRLRIHGRHNSCVRPSNESS
jgi:hypothetical protein